MLQEVGVDDDDPTGRGEYIPMRWGLVSTACDGDGGWNLLKVGWVRARPISPADCVCSARCRGVGQSTGAAPRTAAAARTPYVLCPNGGTTTTAAVACRLESPPPPMGGPPRARGRRGFRRLPCGVRGGSSWRGTRLVPPPARSPASVVLLTRFGRGLGLPLSLFSSARPSPLSAVGWAAAAAVGPT